MQLLIFYVFGGISVVTAIIMISNHKPVNCAIALVTTMCCTAVFYVLLDAHLLAAFQMLVYAGAIMILFLFVIMLLNLREKEGAGFETHHFFWQVIVVGVFSVVLTKIIELSKGKLPSVTETIEGFGTVESAGRILFTKFLLPFELASVILTAGIVGAVVLAMNMKGKKRSRKKG